MDEINYLDMITLFFTQQGIIVESKNNNAFLPFNKTKKDLNPNNNYNIYPVKKFLAENNQNDQFKILKSYQLLNWHNRSKYCGTCGNILAYKIDLTEKNCDTCKASVFPRFSPAIMVLIIKDKKILLGRSHHFQKGMYSALAGFIDLGETAEDAVYREVKEEVGISIKNIKYFGTQSWPFPDSFMIAFTAKYHEGDIIIDEDEIDDANWFDINNLPTLPSHISISRQLIDNAILEIKKQE